MRLMYFAMGGIAPFNIGGTSTVAYNLIRHYDKQGIELDVVTVILKENMPEGGLNKFFGLSDNTRFHPIIKEDYDNQFSYAGFKGMLELCNLVNKIKPDIIHYNLFPSKRDSLVPLLAKIKTIPQVYTYHGRYWKEVSENYSVPLSFFFKKQFKLYQKFYDEVIVNSKDMKHYAHSEGFEIKNIKIIPNGIDIDRFRNARPRDLKGSPSILYVGRLERIKGVDMLLEAHNQVIGKFPNAILHIVGDGNMQNQLYNQVKTLNIVNNVVFHGFIPVDALLSFYKSADICVFPSRYEPFGIVVLEAMASGVPTIASNIGGISEIITDKLDGLLTELNQTSIVENISSLWNDEELRNNITTNAEQTVKNYSWDRISNEYITLYKELMNNK